MYSTTFKIVLGLLIASVFYLGWDYLTYSRHARYIAMLTIEAPETLQPPQRNAFTTEAAFRVALYKYAMRGNWATE